MATRTPSRDHRGRNIDPSPYYGALQEIVDGLFIYLEDDPASDELPTIRRLDMVMAVETADLPEELVDMVRLLPPGDYTRQRLCQQLNSAINGHAWGQVYGTVQ